MSAMEEKLICSKCHKRVSYSIFRRPVKVNIKEVKFEYEEYYGICEECKAEIFVPGLDDRNEEAVENQYRHIMGLITIQEIKKICKKYNVEKRPLSKLLGFGELTITRYIDGQLPSKKYSDILIEVLNDEIKMKEHVVEYQNEVSTITVNKVLRAIESIEKEKKNITSVERIATYIVGKGRDITNLLLQKVLYYVKAIGEVIAGEPIIPEPCEAWKYGPVFPTVYEKYRDFGKQAIESTLSSDYIDTVVTTREKEISDFVLNTFGIYNAWFLKDLTHAEEPWIDARKGLSEDDVSRNQMDDKVIKSYFARMDKIYNLKSAKGVQSYINEMKHKMY